MNEGFAGDRWGDDVSRMMRNDSCKVSEEDARTEPTKTRRVLLLSLPLLRRVLAIGWRVRKVFT